MNRLRKHLGTIAVAGVTAFVVAAGPALAATTVDLARNALALGGKPASAYLLKTTAANTYLSKAQAAETYLKTTARAHNSDQVDGVHADELNRLAYSNDFSYPSVTEYGTDLEVAVVTVGTTGGSELVRGSADFYVSSHPFDSLDDATRFPCGLHFTLLIDGNVVDDAFVAFSYPGTGENDWAMESVSLQGTASVGPGDHSVTLSYVGRPWGSCTANVGFGSMSADTALYDGSGAPPPPASRG